LRAAAGVESRLSYWQQRGQTRKLAVALAQTADSILITNRDGVIEYVNPAFERLTGYAAEEVRGKTPRILKSGKHRPEFYQQLWKTILAGQVFRATFLNQAKNGELFYEDRTITPLTNDSRRVTHFVSAGRNTTERKRAEEIQTRLTSILEATPDLVVTTDSEGRIHYMNRAGRRMLGLSPTADIPKLRLTDVRPLSSAQNTLATAIPTALREGTWSGESAFLTSNGDEIAVSEVIIAHRSQGGEVHFLSSIARDIRERKRFETQLVYMADHDPLTSLYSRRRFHEELSRHLEEALRYGTHGAVLFMDLDDFKIVNDNLGHRAGDALLVSLSSLFRKQLRLSDVLARLGGDEFAFLLPRATREEAKTLATRLVRAVRQHVISLDDRPCRVTASVGVALFPEHGNSTEELLSYADLAMYRAKETGRNRVDVYAEGPRWRGLASSKLWGEQTIREALEHDQLTLHAQPILGIGTNRISEHELLLRMKQDEAGSSPRALLHTAERFGLIHAIDHWVVLQAIQMLRRLNARDPAVRLSVNLSGKTLSDGELLSVVRLELAEASVNPGNLTFEITETASIADAERARDFMENLRTIGCRFALDDFGVGFSSLTQLKELPVDYLKIDGSFMKRLPESEVDQHLVRAIVEVARGLRMRTIAEFVEDAETLDLCRQFGVDFVQGYFVGRPRPASELLNGGETRHCPTRR
jgi:diguanylate cyclase (GGDEF)-like protein/PAS domain S-box-containing protein